MHSAAVLSSRSKRVLNAVAAIPPRALATVATTQGHRTAAQAVARGGRTGAPNVVVEAHLRVADGLYVPVVRLRADQLFMADNVRERGVPALPFGVPAE